MNDFTDSDKDLRSLTVERLNQVLKQARQSARQRLGRIIKQNYWPDIDLHDKLVRRKGGLVRAVFQMLHRDFVMDLNLLESVLEKDVIEQLRLDGWHISQIFLDETQQDPDGTVKYRFRTADGHCFESVMMFLRNRTTACLSSQLGCRMGCKFCATSRLKFIRSLTAGEIIAQLYYLVARHGNIDNVVYMGMGEPFDNYAAVADSVAILTHYAGQSIPPGRLTVSTCGLPAGIRQMSDDDMAANLAVSLHSGTDDRRAELMASARRYSLAELFEAVKYYYSKTGKRVLMEYCMIAGANDSDEDCRVLVELLTSSGIQASVNLIEFNSHELCDYQPSDRGRINYFCDELMQSGIETTIRFKRGESIKAACGQLCNG